MKGEIIYVSSNKEDWSVENRIIDNISKVTKLPILSVTQKPVKFGRNIDVGDVGVSGFNMFRQILIGLKNSNADYVISCEADSLYPPDYFEFIPENLEQAYRSKNIYIYHTHDRFVGKKLFVSKSLFYPKPVGSTVGQIIGREYYMSILESLFEGAPEWSAEEISFPKERKGQADIFLNVSTDVKYFNHENPIVSLKTRRGMRNYSNTQGEAISELPYWGKAVDFITNVLVN
jgi:hypothetical protein